MIKYCLDLGIYIFFLGPLNIMSLITRFQNQPCITNAPMVYLHSVLFFPIHGVLVAQSRPTLCDPMDHSLPSSFVHWILQARMLPWVAIPFSRGSSQPRDLTWVSRIGGRYFTIWATRLVLPIYSQVVFWECGKSGETYQAYFFIVILGYCSLLFIGCHVDSLWCHKLQHTRLPCPSQPHRVSKLISIEWVMPSNHINIFQIMFLVL